VGGAAVVRDEDRDWVREQLGRDPSIPWTVAVRSREGWPIVIELAPYDTKGRPQSNWFWLVDRRLVQAVARIEARGGVRRAEKAVDPRALELANLAHASARRNLPHPTIAGTRAGVKCLHAHLALYLAGGFSPVGVWTMGELVLLAPELARELADREA
jgi:hypothetical protein